MIKVNETPLRTSVNYGINDLSIDEKILNVTPSKFDFSPLNATTTPFEGIELKRTISSVLDKQSHDMSNLDLNIVLDKKLDDNLIIEPSKAKTLISNINILIKEDITAKVIIKLDGNISYSNLKLKVTAEKDSNLDLAIVCDIDGESFLNYEANLEENANLNAFVFDFCKKLSVQNINFGLNGENAKSNLRSIYLGEGNEVIDLNYLNEVFGKNCIANIEVVGALKDKASKNFKGTVNLIKGCKRSCGSESEFCTLLSHDAKSKALPMLLCTEEDVDGKHSTATGQIDDKQMFYLMSRGLSQKEAQKLIVLTKFNTIINCLFDDNLKNIIFEIIDRKFD